MSLLMRPNRRGFLLYCDCKKKQSQFQRYNVYMDEIEQAEKTDIWIVSNEQAENPLDEDYTNAEISRETITKQMGIVMEKAYKGQISSNAAYDQVYGMVILYVAVPIKTVKTKEVCGAVLMVSMVDKQTMGIDEGKYLISISLFISAVVSIALGFAFSKYLSRPLEKIGKYINRIAAGDYSGINVKKPAV